MFDSDYDVAQICKNGHVVNSAIHINPTSNQKYCEKCGEQTIMSCPSCKDPIRGDSNAPEDLGMFDYERPSYCHNCGTAFPWTTRSIEAAKEFVDEMDGLTSEEKELLKSSFPDLIRHTPKTAVAETRFKRLIAKAGKSAYEGMKTILIDVVSEAAKEVLFRG